MSEGMAVCRGSSIEQAGEPPPSRVSCLRVTALLAVLLLAWSLVGSGCLYTKAPCFPEINREAHQRLGRVEFSTPRRNPEDGPLRSGEHGYAYCPSPPCTLVGSGKLHVLHRVQSTWISLDYLRVRQPGQGTIALTHETRPDGRRLRIDDGRGHERDLHIDLAAVARLHGLGKGDLIGLTIHQEGSPQVERYYFELRRANGNGVPDRLDLDLAVGILPFPEVARDLDPPGEPRYRGEVGQATFPLALQLSLGWNTVRRSGPLAELVDRLDLVLGLAVVNLQGLPSGLEAKTSPAFGPGIRIHRLFNLLWYFDLFGEDPVSFPVVAISLDETLRVASSLMRTDVIYKEPAPRRFRVGLSGGSAGSLTDVGASLKEMGRHSEEGQGRDPVLYPSARFSFGRVWGEHWTFPQVDIGLTWIPQQGSDDDLVFVQVTLGPRFDLSLFDDRVALFVSPQGGFYQGYLLREEGTNESRLRSGFALPAGLSIPIYRDGGVATWQLCLSSTLHLIHDFAGSGRWTRYLAAELGFGVEF